MVPQFEVLSTDRHQASSSHCSFVYTGETIPIRLFLGGFDLTPTFRDVNKKFSTRYYLNLVLIDEENRRYFKQQVCGFDAFSSTPMVNTCHFRRSRYSGYQR